MAASNENGAGEEQTDFSHLAGRYLVFQLEEVSYGLHVTAVQEIVQMMEITRIPRAPDYVRGLLSLRGKTLPAIELRKQFELADVEDSNKTCIIVVEIQTPKGGYRAGLIVDEVAEVLDLTNDQITDAPELGQEERGRFIKALGVVDGNITVLLDLEKVLGFAEFDLAGVANREEIGVMPPEGGGADAAPEAEGGGADGDEPRQPDGAPAAEAPANGTKAGTAGEQGMVRHISGLLQQLPKGSAEYAATSELLKKMEEFFQVVNKAEGKEIDAMLTEFDLAEQPLLQELGRLVRRFHTEIKSVGKDVSVQLGKIAEHDMSSAGQRLEHIIEMTETAANTTMNLAEEMMQGMTGVEAGQASILKKLDKALDSKKHTPAADKLLKEAAKALRNNQQQGKEHQEKLTEILMAQGFQDLTGQVVQKIVSLLGQLESELLALVEAFGTVVEEKPVAAGQADPGQPTLEGPLSEKSEVKQSQDEVDNLLESLGF